MDKTFISPSRYVQGKDLLSRSNTYIKQIGQRALILADDFVWGIAGNTLFDSLTAEKFVVAKEVFRGEASTVEIERIVAKYKDQTFDMLIGVGGGKTLDVAKAIAEEMNIAMVSVPTTASTDAPTSQVSVIYTEDGVFDYLWRHPRNPDLVLVDTQIIAQAPVRTLTSGIADALATWVEARASMQNFYKTDAGGLATMTAAAIAEKCEEILFDYGVLAMEANENKLVTPALEAIIEANTLLSGLGFENAGLGAAHAIHNGFTAIDGDVHHLTHGEKVAYGTMVQLVLEGRPLAELERYIALYIALDLPITLKQVHLDKISEAEFVLIAEKALSPVETIHSMPFEITPGDIVDAIKAVDLHVTSYKKRHAQ